VTEISTHAAVGSFHLWSDELEAMRAEARAAVEAGRDSAYLSDRSDPALPRDEQVAEQRAMMARVTFPVPEAEERTIGGVPCRVLRPDGAARAVYLHFHGGGMVCGSAAMMDIPNQMLAREHDLAVVSVEYRKAPEFPYPAGPDDGVAVARELLATGEAEFGTDRMLIGGESAGGYMTAAVALRIRDELGAIDRVDGCNMVFAILDFGRSPSQRGMRPTDEFDVLSVDAIELITDCYLPGRTDDERRAPEISPAYADLRGLPPCFVSVGTCDHLLDDSLLFATRAAAAGVAVDLFVLPEMPHAFQMFDCAITRAWSAAQTAWIASRLR
jgi:acetyl esterase/lipase